ncbi:hypothetical protein K493DRAFT_336648 [Basidiobolus meristosporus CBS 931.73]|uniref:DNA mismatch repair protein MutL n=1 Tax=Basidiobolus meristosporus CBS 931.73 TaxID=1314790 RepID=A0A1Y1YHM0_9FUNG|nr:hypothetical protein K493DRAFT_336648 [Basidiobolus meristosporus CBS 931.73]|eukprot:ORX97206.1 hypothetical protein K493DRAFT_336648 [Basidiobolus meristosporus CBS 931.73]
MSIKAIDRLTVHRICSGQVVLNLANAVKELIENSLDAGSSTIEIKLRDSGLDLIEIIDNGNGIEPEDYDTIALKHYTSKLRDFDELTGVSSFGFRGEALSSLCALSSVRITTATRTQAPRGNKLEFNSDGKIESTTPCAREAYAIISENVKFVLSNQPLKGNRQIALSTKGNKTSLENIANIFGAKIAAQLTPLELKFSMSGVSTCIQVVGHISKPTGGAGRSCLDRQFFYINGRPCDLPKIAKVFNEIYRTCNSGQYPFVVANILIDTSCYDVNVTPDKRTIYIHNEKELAESLKSYMPTPEITEQDVSVSQTYDISLASPSPNSNIVDGPSSQAKSEEVSLVIEQAVREVCSDTSSGQTIESFSSETIEFVNSSRSTDKGKQPTLESEDLKVTNDSHDFIQSLIAVNGERALPMAKEQPKDDFSQRPRIISTIIQPPKRRRDYDTLGTRPDPQPVCSPKSSQIPFKRNAIVESQPTASGSSSSTGIGSQPSASLTAGEIIDPPLRVNNLGYSNSLQLNFDMSRYHSPSSIDQVCTVVEEHTDELTGANLNELDNEKAESILERVISKSDFLNMQVVGQFNLGFIIARLKDSVRNDLFIIDQHASDEKYRFESLQKSTVIQTQRLLIPKPIELTAADELVAVEYSHVLKENGFEIEYNPDRVPTKRIKLLTVPYSKQLEFGVQDLEELIHLLTENPGESVKFSRIRKMFASRACRSAVMIGDPLTKARMEKIVRHMAEIDQPWNCPHGRPTMRHISDLKQIHKRAHRFRRRLNKGSLYNSTHS